MKKIYLFAAAALMLASCAKDIVESPSTATETDGTEEGYVTLTFTASHPERTVVETPSDDATTKTAIQADGTVTWEEGDRLKLIIDGDEEDVITDEASISADGKTATFKATIKEGKAVKYAVYPTSIEATLSDSGEDLNVTVPNVQDGTFANASIEVGTVGEDNEIKLKNVCSLLKFTVANDGATKVFIGGNGAPFAGTAKVNAGILGATTYTDATDVPDYSPNIEIDLKGDGPYYAAILPAKTTGLSMQIYNGSNEVLAENISSNVLDAGRGTIKNLGELSNPKFNVRFVTPDGAGKKDGSSWDDAIPFSNLLNQLKTTGTTFTNHRIFMASGEYRITENIITIKAASTFKIYGGFPGDLKGRELTSRDLNKYSTNILGRAGNDDDRRHFQINGSNQITFDGICFKDSYQKVLEKDFNLYAGTSLLVGNAKTVCCVNCLFDKNEKIGDSIIRVGTNDGKGVARLELERCTFLNNSVSRNGLIRIYGASCVVKLTDCDFSINNTIGGDNKICTVSNPTKCVIDDGGNQLGGHTLY